MRLSLDVLTVLDAIDRRGTFAAAAEELHRVPSSLSYLVQKLESELGVTVFDRSGHRARLTPTGTLLVEEGRRLLQAAATLESRARRIETGWESELRIALDTVVPFERLLPLVKSFYAEHSHTQIRIGHEVLGGCWDALLSQRADLVVGASGEPPSGSGLTSQLLEQLEVVFCVAPDHPLAQAAEPLSWQTIAPHRLVSLSDSSHRQPPRAIPSAGGQEVFGVATLTAQLEAQLAGLGCGHLPWQIAKPHVQAGRLIVKTLLEAQPPQHFHLGWRSHDEGPALRWWLERLNRPDFIRAALLEPEME
ncbi:LysR family transcriptional regulator [Chitinimonas lacunae]|uniref:LysR family transcriptional regulator n=1 Tax=Chitinimonas lacunae TaxID=1963018 RepID=A0ABV8MNJ3_9NEIS